MKRSSAAPERDARGVAYRVLTRVVDDAAFASRVLDAEIARAGLDARDARLAANVTYGTLRRLHALDAALAPRCKRPLGGDPLVASVLRAATYQLAALDRAGTHAVVDHAVGYVKERRGPRVAGFVNAVLRAMAVAPPVFTQDPVGGAEELGLAPEVAALFVASTPDPMRAALLEPGAPPLDLRVQAGARDAWIDRLRAARPDARVEPTPFAPSGIRTERVGDPRSLPGFDEGAFVVQDEGSQLVVAACRVAAGARVLDACAGRGGKTLALATAVGPSGRVFAADVHEAKLDALLAEAKRLGLEGWVETHPLDLSVGVGDLPASFDLVLVDAPCSGLGTLRRRPEIARRLDAGRIAGLVALQRAILRNAASRARVGGRVVFAVCSPLDAESVEVVTALDPASFRSVPFVSADLGGLAIEPDGSLRLGPLRGDPRHAMDAYRVFCFERV